MKTWCIVIWQALSWMGILMSSTRTVCFQSGHVYADTYKSVGCPLAILAGARQEVRCQQYAVAFSIGPQQAKHEVIVCLKWQHQCNPWCVWKVCLGSAWNHEDLQILI